MLNFFEGHRVYMDGEYPAVFLDGKNTHVHRYVVRIGVMVDVVFSMILKYSNAYGA